MKKIYAIAVVLLSLAACKSTFPIAMNPNKGTFNSGTIGSIRATDNLPIADEGIKNFNFRDTSHIIPDTACKNLKW
jgi:hypothetical protein